MKLMIAAALMGGVVLAPSAFAQEAAGTDRTGFNWAAGYGTVSFETDLGDVRLGAVQGKFGYRFHQNFGVEGEAAFGVDDESLNDQGITLNLGLKREWGVFGVVFAPVHDSVDLFFRAGYVDMQLEGAALGVIANAGDSGSGIGAGLIWDLGLVDLRAEYTRYEIDGSADTFGVSVGGKF